MKTHRRFRFEHTVIELEGWEWDEPEDDEDEDSDDDDDENFGVSVSVIRAMMGSLGMGDGNAEVQGVFAKLRRMQETESGERIAGLNELDEYEDSMDSDIPASTIRNGQRKVGRNDPCPCGSGKKYKNCYAQVE
ncbi:MAG TPA: SEC-C metal-binding domain-containing protein [Planctomycetaceae bacterium]|nr:SEC-C metal-binding domain-containing protein [Planctomycetaceae bacterium]